MKRIKNKRFIVALAGILLISSVTSGYTRADENGTVSDDMGTEPVVVSAESSANVDETESNPDTVPLAKNSEDITELGDQNLLKNNTDDNLSLDSSNSFSSTVRSGGNGIDDERDISSGNLDDSSNDIDEDGVKPDKSDQAERDDEDQKKDDEDAKKVGFFTDEFGFTRYRDPETKELFDGGLLELNQFEIYVFDKKGRLVKSDFVDLPDGSTVYSLKDGKLFESIGIYKIKGSKYVFDSNNRVLKDDWYRTLNEEYYASPDTGRLYTNGAYTLKDGVRYVFDENSRLAKGKWVNEPGYGRVYGNPITGAAYVRGGYTLDNGVRYVFDEYGYLAKNKWVDEPGYGLYYGNPETGAAYMNGGFTLKDGIRYVFDEFGLLAKNKWVDEPGYGRYFGNPYNGSAYSKGAFTVSDGIRYVFDEYGLLAKDKWVNEAGYGLVYGNPNTGAAYTQGAFTLKDGARYVFDKYGYLAKGKWVNEPGYGRTYGDPRTGKAYTSGSYNIIEDGKKIPYVFNEEGYATWGWVFEPGYGWTFGWHGGKAFTNEARGIDGVLYVFGPSGHVASGWIKDKYTGRMLYGKEGKIDINDRERGKAYANKGFFLEGEWKPFDYKGLYTPRSWGGSNGSLVENGTKNFIRINLDEQVMYCVRNGKIVMATPVVTGDVKRYMQTPRGTFRLLWKTTNAVLTGVGYVSHVKYWLPFTNVGHGIHDANNWRQNYGNTVYIDSGSHGCVNTPRESLGIMYDHVYVGMPIFIH